MSKTKKGKKSPYFEYWSRRPLSGNKPGRETKTLTHGIERAQSKTIVNEQFNAYCHEDGPCAKCQCQEEE